MDQSGANLEVIFPGIKEQITERPLRRLFICYSIFSGPRGLELVDNYEEYDAAAGGYIKKEERRPLIPTLQSKIIATSLSELELFCSYLRREIDAAGVKIFFDPTISGELRAKWRYRCIGRVMTDYMKVIENEIESPDPHDEDPNLISRRILNLVQNNTNYHLTAEWRNWFGRKMQRKRAEIIKTALCEKIKNQS